MTPREIIALTIGILVGLMFAPRAEPCRRGCCVPASSDARRERWKRGEDPETPPTSWTDGWSPRPCASCASLLQDGQAMLYIAEYSRKFADQCLEELHGAALWIDSLLTRA